MKHLVLICLLVITSVVYAQIEVETAPLSTDSIPKLSDSLKKTNSSIFWGKLGKLKTSMADSLMDESSVVGLEEEKDPNIDLLIQDYVENKKFMGYRIQIHASSEKLEALKIRAEFIRRYPNEKSYIIYQAPNFKVRVGNYQDRLITHEHLAPIKIDFTGAFIVKDEIEPSLE